MHHRPVMRTILVTTLFIALVGCAPSSATLVQPRGAASLDVYGQHPSPEVIAFAVRQGTIAAGWAIVAVAPGVVTAQVQAGGHYAVVRIEHDHVGWVILHQESSPSLRFNPSHRGRAVIHHRYNHWVDRLHRHIERALRDQQGGAPPAPVSRSIAW